MGSGHPAPLYSYVSLYKFSDYEEVTTLLLSSYSIVVSLSLSTFLCEPLVMRKWPTCSSLARYASSLSICIFPCGSLGLVGKWPLCSSLVRFLVYLSLRVYCSLWKSSSDGEMATLLLSSSPPLYFYASLYKFSSDEDVATLLLSSSSIFISLYAFLCESPVMRKWLSCSSLTRYVSSLYIHLSL